MAGEYVEPLECRKRTNKTNGNTHTHIHTQGRCKALTAKWDLCWDGIITDTGKSSRLEDITTFLNDPPKLDYK